MSPSIGMVQDALTKADIESFDYDTYEGFADDVITNRGEVSNKDFDTLKWLESSAGGACFGEPRSCMSDIHGEVLEVSLYGNNLDIREIQEFVSARDDILLGSIHMIDDGWKPARLNIIVVDVGSDAVWA